MKLPWKREPTDLVGEQVAEVYKRPLTPAEEERLQAAGVLLIPEEMTFPTTAAGGWCAPSEVIYEMEQALRPSTHPASVVPLMVSVPAPAFEDGLLSLPELSVRRGGIQWGQPAPAPRPMPAPPEWLPPPPVFKDATRP